MEPQWTDEQQENAALWWGGVAGMLGSALLFTVFVFLAILVGLETIAPEAEMARFPEVMTARIVENTFYLLALACWTVHTAALFVALRRTALAPALAGAVMSALGLVILATGAVPHTATAVISDLYVAAAGDAEARAMLLVTWQAVQGLVDALVVTGLVLTPIGMGLLGVAMHRSPAFGPGAGRIGMVIGLAGLVAAVMILVNPNDVAAIGIFGLIFFHLLIGWKLVRVSGLARDERAARPA